MTGRVAAIVCGLGAVAILVGLLVPRPFYTGTNSVRARGAVVDVAPGQRACVPLLRIPAGTARVQMEVLAGALRPPLEGTVLAGGRRHASRVPAADVAGFSKVEFPIPRRPDAPEATDGSVCLRNLAPPGGEGVAVGGTNGATGIEPAPTLEGKPLDRQLAVWYLPPAGEERTVLAQLPDVMRRAALFRPGWVGAWTPWMLVFGLVPLLGFAALRLLARAAARPPTRRGRIPLGLAVALLAFGNAAAWATLSPSFNIPDESEHFAYAEHLAETGDSIDRAPVEGGARAYSTRENHAIEATRILSSNEPGDGRPPWLQGDERRWRERVAATDPPSDDGGGFTVCCNPHSPLYYGLLAPAYHLAGGSTFSQLWLMRLTSALLAALVAACAFGIVRELIPSRPELAVGAGILVAFQPMFAMMGGAVSNDMGVNGGGALVLYLLIRGLRRRLTWRLALALGAALAVLPLLKGTGYALFPIAALAGLGMLVRQRADRRTLVAAGVALASLVVVTLAWQAIAPAFGRETFTTPGGGPPGEGLAPLTNPGGYASYLWQVFLPRLPFMTDLWIQPWPFYEIYVRRGFGAFGWYQVTFPGYVFGLVVLLLMATTALGIVVVVRRWDAVRSRGWETLVLLGVGAVIIAGVEAFYYVPAPRLGSPAEMGRYAFPAIAAFAALAMAACLGAGRRRAGLVAAGLAAFMVVLNTAGQLLALAGFYT